MPGCDPYNLQRFADAQQGVIGIVLAELRAGATHSHWMWFIFPQLAELGHSPPAKYFGIGSIEEARAYLAHPVLGPRLRESLESLLPWAGKRSAVEIFGQVDAMKLRSSLTLFDQVEPEGPFAAALSALFEDKVDELTLALLNARR